MLISLKLALLRAKITQVELARRLKVSETRVSRIVQERAEPAEKEKREIARVLGERVEVLFSEPVNTASHSGRAGR